jgi:hypothetical protein
MRFLVFAGLFVALPALACEACICASVAPAAKMDDILTACRGE